MNSCEDPNLLPRMKIEMNICESVLNKVRQSIPSVAIIYELYIVSLRPRLWKRTPASMYESISEADDVILLMKKLPSIYLV